MRLIDADALLKKLDDSIWYNVADFNEAWYAVDHAPTVEDVPVVHGRWIHGQEVCREYIGITLIMVQYSHWKCSVCGYRTENKPLWKYCPNCGAKMDEKDCDHETD